VDALDISFNQLIITSGNDCFVYDLRKLNSPFAYRSLLQWRMRVVKLMPNEDGCAIGSVEGKVGISHFSPLHSFTFETSVSGNNDPLVISPVNAIDFHPA
jgi:hypothetical protein